MDEKVQRKRRMKKSEEKGGEKGRNRKRIKCNSKTVNMVIIFQMCDEENEEEKG